MFRFTNLTKEVVRGKKSQISCFVYTFYPQFWVFHFASHNDEYRLPPPAGMESYFLWFRCSTYLLVCLWLLSQFGPDVHSQFTSGLFYEWLFFSDNINLYACKYFPRCTGGVYAIKALWRGGLCTLFKIHHKAQPASSPLASSLKAWH